MDPKKRIFNYLQQLHQSETVDDEIDRHQVLRVIDGMSDGTASIIIRKEMGQRISEDYKIEGLENKGRYYLAKITGAKGRLLLTMLVDKQNGNVQVIA